MMIRILLTSAFALFSPQVTTTDPLAGLVEQPIDIELRGAPIGDVFLLVQDVAQVDIDLDPCVGGTIDLALERVTVRTLMEALAAALDLEYGVGVGGSIAVGCASTDAEDRALTIELRDVPIEQVVAIVMPGAGVSGCEGRRVDLEVRNAAPAALMSGLASELHARLTIDDGRVHLSCAR